MSTALQHVPGTGPAALAEADAGASMVMEHHLPGTFTREQVDLIKRTVADGASDDELELFLEVCKSTGLNPFQRQIYAIVRQESFKDARGNWGKRPKMTIQTGIDGYRLIAARTGQHVGTSDIFFEPDDGAGSGSGTTPPTLARVTVLRAVGGQVAKFTATARWNEYVQLGRDNKPQGLWGKMPHTMLGKCVEALALRKAFPAELSGVYTREEMAQATMDGSPPIEDADVVESHPAPRDEPKRIVRPAAPRQSTRDVEFAGKAMWTGPEPTPAASSGQSTSVQAHDDVETVETEELSPEAVATGKALELSRSREVLTVYGCRQLLGGASDAEAWEALAAMTSAELAAVQAAAEDKSRAHAANAEGYEAVVVGAITQASDPDAANEALTKGLANLTKYVSRSYAGAVEEALRRAHKAKMEA